MTAVTSPLVSFLSSSIGKKILVALTGAVLVLFVLGHMIGNLLVFMGPEAINEYGHLLHTMLHGGGVWIARVVIFGSIIVHVLLTIQLTKQNRAARTERYGFEATQVATKSSRVMILTGLTLLAFFIFHILQFTVRSFTPYDKLTFNLHGETVHNVYQMVITGFSSSAVSLFYIVAMGMLCSHLSHGVSSLFQTLGLNTEKTAPLFKKVGWAYALLIFVGNCSIPVAICWFGYGQTH
jgi:succinate dehydrogenase / fumarate reductase cytochrome b subunit